MDPRGEEGRNAEVRPAAPTRAAARAAGRTMAMVMVPKSSENLRDGADGGEDDIVDSRGVNGGNNGRINFGSIIVSTNIDHQYIRLGNGPSPLLL